MADFTMIPNEVVEETPIYHNIFSQSDFMKKEFFNITGTPLQRYKLKFKALSTVDKDVLLSHYKACYGGYDEFEWTSVPSYIELGVNITGRWVGRSLKIIPVNEQLLSCSIVIEKSI